ncbi:EamA family transporter [Arthrobacter sp. efr-133-TYG-118]|uniref:EamA family transporter n=1 Tax=Arthrobacter sp. efr-133-TYG-118 TaxID=3040279 RepID=UPI00254BCB6C|nr:EamA family transporter [Arthrobacter sp. efr-133-TYG-118]
MAVARRASDAAIIALAPIVWGSTYAVTTELLPADRPLLAATVRALPAGIVLLLITRRFPPTAMWWLRAAVLGVLNIGVFFYLLFVAAYELPGGVAALVGSVQPLFVLIISAWFLGATMRGRQLWACLIAVGGIAMLVLRSGAGITPVGVAAAVLGALSMALGVVLTKRWGLPPGASIFAFTAWQLTAGGLAILPLMLALEGLPSSLEPRNLIGFTYLTVIGAMLAYAVWFRGIDRLTPLAVSFLGFFSPLTATVLGALLIGQGFTAVQILGAALVLASVLMVQLSPARGDALSDTKITDQVSVADGSTQPKPDRTAI